MLTTPHDMITKKTVSDPRTFLEDPITLRAINPGQYDLPDLEWASNEGGLKSPMRRLMFRYLLPFLDSVAGKRILEIGCGTGWLLDEFHRRGASLAEGIDPSVRNLEYSSKAHPGIRIHHSDFESFM